MTNPNALAPLPWRLAYEGAATIEDATGRTIVECITPDVAEALVLVVNFGWEARLTNTHGAWSAFYAAIEVLGEGK